LKKKKADLQISLFPFLSILACVIGILTLMITAIVIAQIDPEAVNEKIETALEEDDEFKIKLQKKRRKFKN
jgi:Na+-transporting methylmalonyl-CoA/oxaloacetate decarboxylase gamma subunit